MEEEIEYLERDNNRCLDKKCFVEASLMIATNHVFFFTTTDLAPIPRWALGVDRESACGARSGDDKEGVREG